MTSYRPVFLALLLVGSLGCGKRKPDADGAALYATYCSRCHGANGEGGQGDSGGPVPRRLADPSFFVNRTEEQVKLVVLDGKNNAMPAFRGSLTEEQVGAIVGYVRSMPASKP